MTYAEFVKLPVGCRVRYQPDGMTGTLRAGGLIAWDDGHSVRPLRDSGAPERLLAKVEVCDQSG